MAIVDIRSVAPVSWGAGCTAWPLTEGPELSVKLEEMPPGTAEQRHRHARARQLFFVLSGLLEMELAGTVFEIGAEQALEVPPGAPHQARNPGRDPVRFLVISSPPTSRDRQEVTAPSSPMDDEST